MESAFHDLLLTDTQASAKQLLGMDLYLGEICLGRIVETEAYLGVNDSACHSAKGRRTPRNEAMYLQAGHWYVYQMYGYYMLNLVTRPKDIPEAILIRALETKGQLPEANGPGKLTRLANITKVFDGQSLASSQLTLKMGARPKVIGSRARIGVTCSDHWKEEPLCFYVLGNRHVSHVRKKGLLADQDTWVKAKAQ
ncbi:DNA-3-methyladenine glycosylase [Streptococcus halichoeri]|uniref:DNA-3-methyladenine glycosylase n=1 Tax=Streptococcus halichoeri TaxID=254785 RepID=UPI00135C2AA4|nr:DNA-3-methyladenine glycosylase [Streptococcus halichoeri]